MALINCKECGAKISDSAKSCPSCGNPNLRQEKSGGCSTFVIAIASIILLLFLIGTCNQSNVDTEADTSGVDTTTYETSSTGIKVVKLTKSERKENIEKLRNMFLDTGADIEVSVYGKDNEILELKYALFNDVWFRKFETEGMFDNFNNLGYKIIILNDNYDYKKSMTYQ